MWVNGANTAGVRLGERRRHQGIGGATHIPEKLELRTLLPSPAEGSAVSDTTPLTAPFLPTEVKFKPQSVKGNRALALAYIDCRVIQDRLYQSDFDKLMAAAQEDEKR